MIRISVLIVMTTYVMSIDFYFITMSHVLFLTKLRSRFTIRSDINHWKSVIVTRSSSLPYLWYMLLYEQHVSI